MYKYVYAVDKSLLGLVHFPCTNPRRDLSINGHYTFPELITFYNSTQITPSQLHPDHTLTTPPRSHHNSTQATPSELHPNHTLNSPRPHPQFHPNHTLNSPDHTLSSTQPHPQFHPITPSQFHPNHTITVPPNHTLTVPPKSHHHSSTQSHPHSSTQITPSQLHPITPSQLHPITPSQFHPNHTITVPPNHTLTVPPNHTITVPPRTHLVLTVHLSSGDLNPLLGPLAYGLQRAVFDDVGHLLLVHLRSETVLHLSCQVVHDIIRGFPLFPPKSFLGPNYA